MPIFGLRLFDSRQDPAERRRLGLLYAGAFCLLVFAIDLNKISSGEDGSLVGFLPVFALLTGALAFVILHATSGGRDRAEMRRADLARLRSAPITTSTSEREPANRDTLERLASFTQWRRSRASKFEEYGLSLPEVDGPRPSADVAAKAPKGRARRSEKAVDVWAKVLQEFDDRNSDKRS